MEASKLPLNRNWWDNLEYIEMSLFYEDTFREIHDAAPTSLCSCARGVQFQQLNARCREDSSIIAIL